VEATCAAVPPDRVRMLDLTRELPVTYVWTHGRVSYVLSLHGYANEAPGARDDRGVNRSVLERQDSSVGV
jgi:hypothetical protein